LHFVLAAVAHAAATASPAPAASGNVFTDTIHALFGWIPVLIAAVIEGINGVVHNLGISLILVAALIRLLFWPLNTAQFKSMLGMQKIAPKVKKLQERFKNDQQRLQKETMQLYKDSGVNPLAGCWPTLVQLPILFSVYYAVVYHRDLYEKTSFLWIGSALSSHPWLMFGVPLIAGSLAAPDLLLVLIYMVSQYIAMRFTTMPPTDPAQAQQLKIMQVMSPLMIGFFGFKAQWPAAMVLYWLSYNLFTMGQQLYLLRRYHEPLSFIDSDHVLTEGSTDAASAAKSAQPQKPPSGNGAVSPPSKKKRTKGPK
jgi:YidC/Oxa1 family membrane protein insertase